MFQRYIALGLGAVLAISAPFASEAADNYSMRKKVIQTAGIVTAEIFGAEEGREITRGEFARMLVNASSFRSTVNDLGNVSLYADVPAENAYAPYIRIAVEQGWMMGYLGNLFKPDQPVSMLEGVRGLLALLGYTNEDFTGNQAYNRMAKAAYLELNEDCEKDAAEPLTLRDCTNLFYNLLRTNTKPNEGKTKTDNTVYASVFDYNIDDSGEINPLEQLESKLKGPYAMEGRSLSAILPFSPARGTYMLNGESSTREEVADEALIIYYNASTKSVYGYNEEGNGSLGASEGTLDAVYYGSSNVMIPTQIEVDGVLYDITSSEMQYAFSVYGSVEVGDTITVIWQEKGSSSREEDDGTTAEYELLDFVD